MTPGRRTQRHAPLPSTYTAAPGHRFKVGDRVVVKRSFPPGHRRTPYYIRGKQGVIERICGAFSNPEELAYGFDGEPRKVLYRVRFVQNHVWEDYAGTAQDVIEMEIFEHWLEPAPGKRAGSR
jgi:nitrile hydratase